MLGSGSQDLDRLLIVPVVGWDDNPQDRRTDKPMT
jgi:hypothetical protein